MPISYLSPPARRIAALATTNSGVLIYVTICNLGLRMISSILLTRLLMPEAFGIVGIIGSIFYIIAMTTDLGFNAYIIPHEKGDDPHFINVLWTMHVIRGGILTVLGIASAPLIALVLNKPELTWPAAAAMVTLFIGDLKSFGTITTLRHEGAKRLATYDLTMTVIQTALNVAFALIFRNVWALIAAMIVQSGIKAALSYTFFKGPKPRIVRDPAIARDFFSFSKIAASSSVIALLVAQSDKIVLARLFSLAEFGIYGIAVTLASVSTGFADTYVSRVLYPRYARAVREDASRAAECYYSLRRPQSLAYAFLCGSMIGGAATIVGILYDRRYAGAGTYLSILLIGGLFRLPNAAAAEMSMALGSYKPTLRGNIARLVWVIVFGAFGYLVSGVIGVIIAVGSSEIGAALYFAFVLQRARVYNWRDEATYVAVAAAAAGLGFLVSAATAAFRH